MTRIRQAAFAVSAAAIAAGAVTTTAIASPTASTPTATTPTTTTPAPATPAPTTAAVSATATIAMPKIFVVKQQAVTVPDRAIKVAGQVKPFVKGQKVTVAAFLGHKLVKREIVSVRAAKGGKGGVFDAHVKSAKPGMLTIKVSHTGTSAMKAFSTSRKVNVLSPHASLGSTGLFVDLIQNRLAARHIYLPMSGKFDSYTGLAIDAYHRLLSQGVAQTLDPKTIDELLNGVGTFTVKYPNNGPHAEGDLTHQLLALTVGSNVRYIFPISSGKPSTPTILGNFQIYRRSPGYLSDGMYYSSFFIRGYAIHGYDPAPDYPASHGCMRLPIQDAIFVYNWLNMGDWVDTYYR